MKSQTTTTYQNSQATIIGYMHIIIESMAALQASQPIHAHISIGELSKVDSIKKPSGSTFNETFLLQIPRNPSRLAIICQQDSKKIGQCRYDINPFIEHQAITHSVQSDLFDNQNKKQGIVKLKLTYFSSKYGKLKVRVFGLEFHEAIIKQYKQAKVKVRFGMFAQSTPVRPLDKPIDEVPTMNLSFDVVHTQGVLATYTIPNAQEGGMLTDQPKAFQVSLFNKDKAVGMIKYQLNLIKN